MGENSWAFLLVGSFAAVGAAMMLGTLAALVRYHRTGVFPGAETGTEIDQRRLTALWVRVGIGAVLTIVGVVAIQRTGIF